MRGFNRRNMDHVGAEQPVPRRCLFGLAPMRLDRIDGVGARQTGMLDTVSPSALTGLAVRINIGIAPCQLLSNRGNMGAMLTRPGRDFEDPSLLRQEV